MKKKFEDPEININKFEFIDDINTSGTEVGGDEVIPGGDIEDIGGIF